MAGGSAARRLGGSAARRLGGSAARRLGGSAARRLGGSAARRLGGSAARRLGGSAARRLGGSAARRLGGSAARRLGGSAARRLGGSAARRLGGSAARRLGGSAARRLGGSAARRLGGHYRPSPCGDCQPPERTFLRRMRHTRHRALVNPLPARQSAHGRVHPSKADSGPWYTHAAGDSHAPIYDWYTKRGPKSNASEGAPAAPGPAPPMPGGDRAHPPRATRRARAEGRIRGASLGRSERALARWCTGNPADAPPGLSETGPGGPCRTANPALPAARRGGSLRNMCGGTRALR